MPIFNDLINQRNQLLSEPTSAETNKKLEANKTEIMANIQKDFTNKNLQSLFDLKMIVFLKIENDSNRQIPPSKELAEIRQLESPKLKKMGVDPTTNDASSFKRKAKGAIGSFQFSIARSGKNFFESLKSVGSRASRQSRPSKRDRPE